MLNQLRLSIIWFLPLCLLSLNVNGNYNYPADSLDIINNYTDAIVENQWDNAYKIACELFSYKSEKESLTAMLKNNNLQDEAQAWVAYRLIELHVKKFQEGGTAHKYLPLIMNRFEFLKEKDRPKFNLLISDVYEEVSLYDSSLLFLNKVIESKNHPIDFVNYAELLNRKGNLKNRLNNYDAAIETYKQAIDVNNNPEDTSLTVNSYHGIAYGFRKKGQLDSSAFYEYQSLKLSEEISYAKGKYLALQSLAILSYIQKEHKESIIVAKKLVDELGAYTKEKSILANTYNLIGVNYGNLAKYDSALYFHQLSLTIKKEMGNPGLITSSLNNIAAIYLYKNKPDSAISYLLLIKPIMEELKDSVNLATLYSNIGNVYQQNGKMKEAKKYYKLSEDIASKMNAQKQLIVALSGRVIVDTILKDYKSAFTYQSKMLEVKEDLLNFQKQAEVSRLKEEFETEKKEEQLKTSQEQLSLEKKISASKSKMIYGAAIAILILSILLIIVWKLYITNKKLRFKNELLLSEQNHRIKNNLQMVSNLLSLQSKAIISPEGRAALVEGQHRISSVTLLHKMLYKENNYTEIKFQNYINSLCEEIKASVDRDLKINIAIEEEINIPIEKILSVGILINELIMNSVKHVEKSISLEIQLTIRNHPTLTLNYSDNGQGITREQWANSTSFGNRLIKLQTQQLNSKCTISSEKGFNFQLVMEKSHN